MSRRNNSVRLEGTLWVTKIECRAEGMGVKFKIRTERKWLGGHHCCLALNHTAAETLAFVLAHQMEMKKAPLELSPLTIKNIIDLLNNQYTVQGTFDGWAWSDEENKETYFLTDNLYFYVGERERSAAMRLADPLEKLFKSQIRPLLVTQANQKTVPLNRGERRMMPPLLDISIAELDYDELFNMDPESRAERTKRQA